MARFRDFQHIRWKQDRHVDDAELVFDATPKEAAAELNANLNRRGIRKLTPDRPEVDKLRILIARGDSIAHVDLTDGEIDALIYELSRLERFYNPKLHAVWDDIKGGDHAR